LTELSFFSITKVRDFDRWTLSTPANKEEGMSSLSVNSLTNPYQTYLQSSSSQSRSNNFQSLANALQSGNLSGAQSAFSALEQSYQSQNGQSSTSNQNSTINNDFQNLSSALNSGNLSSAQQAFAQLQKDMQSQQTGHHHHHGGSQGQAVQSLISSLASNSNSSSTSGTGNTLNVTA
jgi:hypothetical protein